MNVRKGFSFLTHMPNSIEMSDAAWIRGFQKVPDHLKDFSGTLFRRIMASALDDLQASVGYSSCKRGLMFRRELKVVTARQHQVGTLISPS